MDEFRPEIAKEVLAMRNGEEVIFPRPFMAHMYNSFDVDGLEELTLGHAVTLFEHAFMDD